MPLLKVCINPVPEDADQETIEKEVNFPTLPRAIESNLIFKELAQMRLTRSAVPHPPPHTLIMLALRPQPVTIAPFLQGM